MQESSDSCRSAGAPALLCHDQARRLAITTPRVISISRCHIILTRNGPLTKTMQEIISGIVGDE